MFWLVLLGITLVTGLIAGSYPALFLSSLSPVRVLKGALKFGAGARTFRQGLVVFQFVLSMLLIAGTLIVYRQVRFIQSRNLGYDREQLVYVPVEGELAGKFKAFREELLHTGLIQSVSTSFEGPTTIGSYTIAVHWPGKPDHAINFYHTGVGYDFLKTIKASLVAGRDFSPDFGADTLSLVINETAAKRIGYKDPVGQPLQLGDRNMKIIGVVKDFNFQSLHSSVEPLILWLETWPDDATCLIRTKAGKTAEALTGIEKLWKQFNPAVPFTYTFADAEYQQLYKSETMVGRLTRYFAFLAIFISCLGLLGLSAFMAEQRTKEIGVRKVLGASVQNVIMLLSKDFLKLVIIAIVLASPLAWYAMSRWLENFAYHVNMEWWVLMLAGLLAICIALLTISFQSVKAALTNPVKSLRSE